MHSDSLYKPERGEPYSTLAEGLRAEVGRVVDHHEDLLRATDHGRADIEGEGIVAAGVRTDPDSVDVDIGLWGEVDKFAYSRCPAAQRVWDVCVGAGGRGEGDRCVQGVIC